MTTTPVHPSTGRLAAALLIPCLAAAVQWLLWPALQPFAWILFYPAVFLAAWVGGRWGGVLATLLSAGLVLYIFVPPMFSFQMDNPATLLSIVLFIVMGHMFSYVFERWRRADRQLDLMAQLQASEASLKRSQAAAQVGHWTWDVRLNRVTWSDEMYRIFGLNPIGFSGDLDAVIRTAIHPDDREKVERANAAVSEAGQPAPLEYRVVRPDGTVRIVRAEPAEQTRDEQDRIIRLWGIVQDITARKQAEANTQAFHERFTALFHNAPLQGVIYRLIRDPQGQIIDWEISDINPLGAASLGRPAAQLIGQRASDLFGQATMAPYLDISRAVAASGEARLFETHFETNRADYLSSVFMVGADHYANISVDITARKQAEQRERYYARLYATLSQVNQTIVRVKERAELFDAICEVAVTYGEFKMAWIGQYDAASGQVTRVAEYGGDAAHQLQHVLDLKHEPVRSSTLANAVFNDRVEVNNDVQHSARSAPWRELAAQLGHQSSAAIPLHQQGRVVGVLNLYAADADFFSAVEEQSLLAEMGLDISFALDTLQTEADRQQAEADLRTNLERLSLALDAAQAGFWEWDLRTNENIWSDELWKVYGLEPHSCEPSYEAWRQTIHPADRAVAELAVSDAAQTGTELNAEWRVNVPDEAKERWLMSRGRPVRDAAGQVVRYVGIVIDITARKRAEAALRESEQKYRDLIDGMNDAIMVLDYDTTILDVNHAAAVMLGYSREELLSMKIPDIDLALPPAQIFELAGAMPHDKVQVFQTWHTTKDGRQVPVEVSSSLVSYGGRILILSIARDITERKRAEEALRQSEEQYRFLVDNTSDFIARFDQHGLMVFASGASYRFNGYAPDELINTSGYARIHPAEQAQVSQTLQHVIATGEQGHAEYRVQRKTGEYIWVEAVGRRVSNLAGEPEVVVVQRDITARKQADAALRASETRSRALLEHAPDGIVLVTPDAFTYASPSALRLFDYQLAELFQHRPDELTHPDDLPLVIATLTELLHNPAYRPMLHYRFRHHDGSWRWIESTFSNLLAEPGVEAIVINFRDVTERRQAEAALRDSEARYRLISENTADVIWVLDPVAQKFTYVSPSVEKLRGYTPAEVLAQPVTEALTPESLHVVSAGLAAQLPAFMAQGAGTQSHVTLVDQPRKDGSIVHTEVTTTYTFDARGQVQIIGVSRDITERLKAEEKLRASEERHQQFIDQSFEAIYRTEFDHPIDTALPVEEQIDLIYANAYMAECNQAMADMYHLPSPAAFVGTRLIDAHGGSQNPVNRAAFRKFIENGYKSMDDETVELTADGQTVWFRSNTLGMVENGWLVRLWGTSLDITDRRQAEEALRRSEERFRSAFDGMLEGCQIIGFDWRYIYLNAAAERHNRRPNRELLGNVYQDMWPGIEATQVFAEVKRCLEDRHDCQMENEFTYPNGLVRWFELSIQPVPEGVFILSVDITERKQAEAANRHTHEQLAAVVEVEHALAASLDLDVLYTALQAGIKRLFPDVDTLFISDFDAQREQIIAAYGWHEGQVIDVASLPPLPLAPPGQGTQSQVIHSRQPLIITDGLERRLRPGQVVVIGDRAGGDSRSALYVPMLVQDKVLGLIHIQSKTPDRFTADDVRVLTLVANTAAASIQNARLYELAQHEIVGRKLRERELEAVAEVSAALRAAMSSADMLAVVVDHTQNLLNGTASSIALDLPSTSDVQIVLARGLWAPMTGRRVPREHSVTGHVILSGQPYVSGDVRVDDRVPPHDTLSGSHAVAVVPLTEQVGIIGTLAVGRTTPITPGEVRVVQAIADIAANALHRANIAENLEQLVVERTQKLAAANERLTELDRLKSKFVSDVSHELRTPVTSLSLYIDLLEHGKPEKRDRYVTGLKEQMSRLHKLINDILDLSRLERDRDEGGRSPIDINSIVEHVTTTQLVAAEAVGLRLTCEVAENLPAVVARPDQLTRALTNLVSNAIKYTPAGSVRVQTSVRAGRVCIEVMDTGRGIPADEVPHLFERFYRGRDVSQSTIPGTGLGLSIVKEIIESHGGTVEVESELGRGSTFCIWLPAA